jgi:hypothetical protein
MIPECSGKIVFCRFAPEELIPAVSRSIADAPAGCGALAQEA